MLFDVHGIKQINQDQTQQIDFLIDVLDEAQLRDFCNEIGVVILGLSEYRSSQSAYGDVYVKISYKEKEFEVVLKLSKIGEGYSFASDILGVYVTYLNSFSAPLDDDKIFEILSRLNEEKEKSKLAQREEKKNVEVDDKVIKKMRQLMTQTIGEAEKLLEKIDNKIGLDMPKKIGNAIDLMKKFRISNNLEKMSETYESVIKLMEEAEIKYIEKIQSEEHTDLKDNVVSDLDIVREYERFKSSKLAIKGSKVSGKIKLDSDQRFYMNFGKSGLYLRLFALDIYKKFENRKLNYAGIFDLIELLFVFILLEISLYLIIGKIIKFADYSNSAYYYLSFFGLLGFIFCIINKFKKKSLFGLIFGFIIGIAVFSILRYLVTNYFAI